jgi:hypothetical protein
MAVPLDAVRAFHNAFRKDMEIIDSAADSAAHGGPGLDVVTNRYGFFNEALVWHANGEEDEVFPAMEKVAPMYSLTYVRDHRGLDSLNESLKQAIGAGDIIRIARTTGAYRFFLDFHLNKEEALLYRLFDEKIPLPDQAIIAQKMSRKIPQERYPQAVAWLFPLLKPNDRENMLRIWQQAMTRPVFTQVTSLARAAVGDEWSEMVRRIPELEQVQTTA